MLFRSRRVDAEAITARLSEVWTEGLDVAGAIRVGAEVLGGPDRVIPPADLEVAELVRTNGRRCFRRVPAESVAAALA